MEHNGQQYCYLSDYELVASERDKLLAALKDIFALMDEGFLVRNIQNDHEPDWAIKMLPNIARLKKALAVADAIDKTESGK